MLRFKAIGVAIFVAVALAAIGVGSAFAGEITGSGKWIVGSESAPLNGKSECAYSGLNDVILRSITTKHRSFKW